MYCEELIEQLWAGLELSSIYIDSLSFAELLYKPEQSRVKLLARFVLHPMKTKDGSNVKRKVNLSNFLDRYVLPVP